MSNVVTDAQGKLQADSTVARISAQGDITIKVVALIIIGFLLAILLIGGMIGVAHNEESFGKYWMGILPIISGVVFGLLGFIVGRSVRADG